MASVAVPLIASFVVQKVGESQGWDPRFTAVASMVAGFGAGSLVSAGAAAGSSMIASKAASVAGSTATSVSPHIGMGVKAVAGGIGPTSGAILPGSGLGASMAGTRGIGGEISNFDGFSVPQQLGKIGPPGRDIFAPSLPDAARWSDAPSYFGQQGMKQGLSARPTGNAALTGRFKSNQFDVSGNGPRYQKDLQGNVIKSTFQDELGNYVDAWKTRPTDANGKETGYSQAENFGVSALKTLMKPLPEKAPIRGGGGGGGPQAPAYQGGGQSAPYQTIWSFGQPNQGYKPQGI